LDHSGGFQEGVDAREQHGETIGLGDNGGNAERGGKPFAKDVSEHGVNDDWGVGRPASQQRGSLDAIHLGHGEIEDDEVGLKGACFFNCFDAVSSFAADFKTRLVVEKNANRIPYGNFVFDDEDALGHEGGNIARRNLE
jgi:hypothetical protein